MVFAVNYFDGVLGKGHEVVGIDGVLGKVLAGVSEDGAADGRGAREHGVCQQRRPR